MKTTPTRTLNFLNNTTTDLRIEIFPSDHVQPLEEGQAFFRHSVSISNCIVLEVRQNGVREKHALGQAETDGSWMDITKTGDSVARKPVDLNDPSAASSLLKFLIQKEKGSLELLNRTFSIGEESKNNTDASNKQHAGGPGGPNF